MPSAREIYPTDHHGWAELLPPRKATPALSGNHRVPWTVVGAGVTGLACARRLAELHPGQPVLLLDARIVGAAASGRNSGFVVATSHFPGDPELRGLDNYRRINRINLAGLELLSQQVEENRIDCQWARNGFYHTAAGDMAVREQENFLRYLDRLDAAHEALDRATLQERLGTEYYRVATLIGDGALVQPAALVRGLADTLPANVKLHENSAVLHIDNATRPRLRLADAEVTTDRLVLATNYEAIRLGFLRARIVGSTLAGSFTRVLTAAELDSLGCLDEWGAISLHGGGATLRLTQDHRISIRNTAEYHASRLLSDAQLKRRQHIHRAAFDKRFPQLKNVPFEFFWSGVEGISRNGTNFFGRQRKNIFLAGGYNGSGVSRGTAFGNAIADYASGEDSAIAGDCLASAPAAWLPPRPLLDVGAFFTVRARFRGVGRDR